MAAAVINCLIGLWLMVAPSVLQMNGTTSNNNHIVGPLVITFSVISFWQINWKAIRAAILLGIWLLAALFILHFSDTMAFLSNGLCGVLLILFSSLKRRTTGKFGGGWRSLFEHNPLHLREAEKMEKTADRS